MRKNLIFSGFLALSLAVAMSCSSDDVIFDNQIDTTAPPEQQKNQLLGEWQVKTVHFTHFEEKGIPANDACMIEGIRAYVFKDDHTFTFKVGKGSGFDTDAKKYWEWSGDEKSFEIKQLNPSMPPYNFGFKPTNITLKENEAVLTLTFSATLANGSTAEFTLVKTAINDTASLLTLPNGDTFSCQLFDATTSLKKELLNNTWILEKGQPVFKANFTDKPSQADRAKSILAFSLLNDDKSFFRYTFPMGVASAKADTWVYDDQTNSFVTTYFAEAFGGNDLRFKVEVTKINSDKMEFLFTDDQGTSVKRLFVKHSSFLETEELQSQLDALLNDIAAAGTSN